MYKPKNITDVLIEQKKFSEKKEELTEKLKPLVGEYLAMLLEDGERIPSGDELQWSLASMKQECFDTEALCVGYHIPTKNGSVLSLLSTPYGELSVWNPAPKPTVTTYWNTKYQKDIPTIGWVGGTRITHGLGKKYKPLKSQITELVWKLYTK